MMPYSVSDYIHVLPETSSDERMHVLDDTCWCRPVLAARDAPGRRREYYLTHKAIREDVPRAGADVMDRVLEGLRSQGYRP
jgi:hypothetical protein